MGDDEARGGVEEGGPGSAFQVFIEMENLLDKLKLLGYGEAFCRQLGFKPFSRYPAANQSTEGVAFCTHRLLTERRNHLPLLIFAS